MQYKQQQYMVSFTLPSSVSKANPHFYGPFTLWLHHSVEGDLHDIVSCNITWTGGHHHIIIHNQLLVIRGDDFQTLSQLHIGIKEINRKLVRR